MSLEVQIRRRYGSFQLDAAFTVRPGEPLALLGPSGCGKSAALRCISGIDRPDWGRVALNGRILYDSGRRIDLPPQTRKAGYLFQQYALFPHMTVEQNIAVSLKCKSARRAQTAQWLARLRLDGMEKLYPRQLSGGQQQRAALARLLASEPDMILLDEPLSALDAHLKREVEAELQDILSQFGGPAVWVSHDLREVYRNCSRVCVLDAGKSSSARTFPDLLSAPETVGAAKITGCGNLVSVRPGPGPNTVEVPAWGLTLRTAVPWRSGVSAIGVRENHVHPAFEGEANAFLCRVKRHIDDVDAAVLELMPEGASEDAPALRMELSKESRIKWPGGPQILAAVRPEDILLLT